MQVLKSLLGNLIKINKTSMKCKELNVGYYYARFERTCISDIKKIYIYIYF